MLFVSDNPVFKFFHRIRSRRRNQPPGSVRVSACAIISAFSSSGTGPSCPSKARMLSRFPSRLPAALPSIRPQALPSALPLSIPTDKILIFASSHSSDCLTSETTASSSTIRGSFTVTAGFSQPVCLWESGKEFCEAAQKTAENTETVNRNCRTCICLFLFYHGARTAARFVFDI